ncbi:Glucose--fructose oxidoreductase [Madurella mycetomatis]|uniref:Glucose--fructose oxidoreductase n=1 Tax=Madurella mycetomatis TaxID=100816 RepID=A0A175VYF4_9PEZI|nr:Glucose--fructose oxidoreductase [Madurella mycetomatis]
MIGTALLGAEHLPAIEASSTLSFKAVYSRSQQSAEALAAASKDPSSVSVYFDSPPVEGKSLDDLLRRSDITAVVIALPIINQPEVVEKALKAGKHVLSEKPIAEDIKGAQSLLALYDGLGASKPIWAVAENFRYLDSLRYAAERVREIRGALRTFRLERNGFVWLDNKYFQTEWRKTPTHQGGFLLDGGVHFVAALRFLLDAAGQEIKQLSGFSALLDEKLPPVDTVHAAAFTQDGKSGTIGISFGTEFKSGLEVEIVTTNGAVVWSPTEVKTVARNANGNDGKVEETKQFPQESGVQAEVVAFSRAIEAGKADALQAPLEAFKDLEILQRLLESGAHSGSVKTLGV